MSAASSGAARFGNSGTGGKLAGGQSVRQPLPCSRERPSVSSGRTCGNSSVDREAPWVVSLSTVPGTLPELKKRSVREGTKDRRKKAWTSCLGLSWCKRPHCGGRSDFSQTQTCPLQVEAPFWPLSFGISVRIPLLRDRCFQGVHACVTWAPAPFPVLPRPSLVPHPFPQHRSADTTSIALCGLSAQPRLSFTTCPRDPSLRPVITHSSRSHVNTTSSRKSSYVSLASSLSAIAQQGPEAVAAPRPCSQAARSSPVTLHRSLRFLDK